MRPTIASKCVRVEHLPGSSAGSLMSDMRTWLDHQGIQPVDFKTLTLPFGSVAFDVEFCHPDPGNYALD
jgi:hypothetical protein